MTYIGVYVDSTTNNMSADVLTPAILQYIDNGAYPDSEEVASAQVGPEILQTLLSELRQAQDSVKGEIRSLSQTTAPDIDTWITRARALQTDILRSRDTARAIVAEAEAGKELKAKIVDAGKKVGLLEKEVAFNESLTATLEHIRYANGKLGQVQDNAVGGNLTNALDRLEEAEASIGGLEGMRDNRAVGLLETRASTLKSNLKETATERWNALINVDVDAKRIRMTSERRPTDPSAHMEDVGLDDVVQSAQGLGIFETLVPKLARDIERATFRPRLMVNDVGQVAQVAITNEEVSCAGFSQDTSYGPLFEDLKSIIDFLALHLPAAVTTPLSASLIPFLATRLEDQWLEPIVPLSIDEMPAFQDTLGHVQHLVDHLDHRGWQGTKLLREWVQGAPRTWLTKRRETVLGEVRNLVFEGLRETKIVERVETQVMNHDDHGLEIAGGESGGPETSNRDTEGGEEDWDTAWDEPEPQNQVQHAEVPADKNAEDDIDDASAWELDEPEGVAEEAPDGGDEDEAWGWADDQEAANAATQREAVQPSAPAAEVPAAPNGVDSPHRPPAEREMTLRETFTTTLIPDKLLAILKQIIDDAQTLAGSSYSSSPIAPAASGLYTLPTLALAIYRATAPTAYVKAPSGNSNMLIYNDCSHLASQLRSWQASQPPVSRLRLDADLKALESFAKRAYSSEMESQRTILRDLLDGAQGFSNCTMPPFKGECESAMQQVVLRLRDVHTMWKDVLSDGALLQSLGSLLASVTGKIIAEIEDLGDIGEADSHQLRRLLDKVAELRDIFTQPGESGESGRDLTFIYCPNWLKFQYLGEILESSLADIKYLWNEGELSLEFDAEEVVELIEALFAESDLRRRALIEIRRGGRR